jgi:signal transduction histidine kinase
MGSGMRNRLFAMERALAIEQRELRLFIEELEPHAATPDDTRLAARLNALRERIALEWKAPVSIRVTKASTTIPERFEQAVPLMVHEAIVNALKHGQPSRVSVTVDSNPLELRIIVADDGHGFPFRGRYGHAALVEGMAGPRSLLSRVEELGGQLSIESTDAGARVEIVLNL